MTEAPATAGTRRTGMPPRPSRATKGLRASGGGGNGRPSAGDTHPRSSVRERIVEAAFDLFDERGYEQTTIDQIVERAGAGRTSFFRHYRSKDDVILPDHEDVLLAVRQRLATATDATAIVAVCEAVRLVLQRYLAEGELARRRYRLTSQVNVLRDREIASVARYQRLFREFIVDRTGAGAADELRAELLAAALVSAHNHVLRRWLRGEVDDPMTEMDDALADVAALFGQLERPGRTDDVEVDGTTVLVFRTSQDLADILPAVRRAVSGR